MDLMKKKYFKYIGGGIWKKSLLTITETNMGAMVINGAKYSASGSYMLTDGTAILVEEDVDAYFAGTLVFYEQDEIPLTE